MSKPIEKVLGACSAKGLKVSARGGWYRCPHPCNPSTDTRLSFAFLEQADGVVCVKSHKGYSDLESITALGLEWRDLYPAKVTTYAYNDRKGNRVGAVKRTPDKNFFQYSYEGEKLVAGLKGAKLPMYLAPQLESWISQGLQIHLVEGEKDALSMASRGYPATSKSGGSDSTWEDANVEMFDGADVVIVADKDSAGERAAKDAYNALSSVAKSLRIVEAKQGKDATDHLEAGFSPADFVRRDDLVPPPMTSSGRIVTCSDLADLTDDGAPEGVATGFKGIDSKSECKGIAKGQMSVVCAKPKHGKTAFLCQVTANACEAGHRVLFVTLADLTKSQIWRRIRRVQTGWADTPHDLLRADEWNRTINAYRTFWDLKLADPKDLGGWHVEDVCESIEVLNRRHRFDLIVIDYAQKMTSRTESDRVRATEKVSREIANMASARGFAVWLGSQQTDDGKAWYSREFTADCSLLVHLNAPNGREAREREFFVEHQRFGPSDFQFLGTWDTSTLSFKENA